MRARLLEQNLVTNPHDYSRYNGFIANVRTRHLGTISLARIHAFESLKLYLDPRYFLNSRVARRYRRHAWPLIRNGIASFLGGWKNRMFETTSTF